MRYTVIFDPSKRVREVDQQQAGVTPVLMDVLLQGSRLIHPSADSCESRCASALRSRPGCQTPYDLLGES
jgi:hypothetical protein